MEGHEEGPGLRFARDGRGAKTFTLRLYARRRPRLLTGFI